MLCTFYVIFASVAFGFAPIFVKEARLENTPLGSVLLFSYLISAAMVAIIGTASRKSLKIDWRQALHLGIFGILGFYYTSYFLGKAYDLIPVGLAIMFHFSYPVIVAAIMTLFYKEKITLLKVLSLVLALTGIALLADFKGGISPGGVVFALLSGLCYASYIIAGRKSRFKDLNVFVISFYVNFFGSIFILAQQLLQGAIVLPPTLKAWLFVFGLGTLGNAVALIFLTMAIKILGATNTAILNMLEPFVAVVLGVIIFNESVSLLTAGGCLMVFAAAVLVTVDTRSNN